MSNEEKLSYVRSQMKMAPFQRTAKAIIASIPASLIEPLTAEQLVAVADALHASHEEGKAKAEEEILAEGAIFSPKHGRMLEIEVVPSPTPMAVIQGTKRLMKFTPSPMPKNVVAEVRKQPHLIQQPDGSWIPVS